MAAGVIAVEAGGLRCDGRRVPNEAVLGFEERYDPWTGRAWLHVRGAAHDEPIAPGYGALRAHLRDAFPDRPFVADWQEGDFPAMPLGVPEPWLRLGAGMLAVVTAVAVGVRAPVAALPLSVVLGWVAFGSWGRVRLYRMGVQLGAGWTPRLGWHEVDAVYIEDHDRWARILVQGRGHLLEGTVPGVLVPALRAKVWRLGGLELLHESAPLDLTYARWAPRATGLAGAVAVVGSLWALIQPEPWWWAGPLALATLGFTLVASAAEARAGGWGAGAVLALTALYGVALVALQLTVVW